MSAQKHLINIAGTVCPAAADADFNKWYDTWHIPENMKYKGLDSVTRYKLVRATEGPTVKDYPGYLAIYRFKDFDTFRAWNASQELQEARKGYPELGARGAQLLWRVQFESIKTWQDTPAMSVINVVGVKCAPEHQARFDKWYSERHVPDLLKSGKLTGVTRYKLAGSGDYGAKSERKIQVSDYPDFFTIYYFKDVATAEAYDRCPERVTAHADFEVIAKETGAFNMWRARYKALRHWSK